MKSYADYIYQKVTRGHVIDGKVDVPGGQKYQEGKKANYKEYGLDNFTEYEELEESVHHQKKAVVGKYFKKMNERHRYAFLKHYIENHAESKDNGTLVWAIGRVASERQRKNLRELLNKKK